MSYRIRLKDHKGNATGSGTQHYCHPWALRLLLVVFPISGCNGALESINESRSVRTDSPTKTAKSIDSSEATPLNPKSLEPNVLAKQPELKPRIEPGLKPHPPNKKADPVTLTAMPSTNQTSGYGGSINLWEGGDSHEVKTLIGHSRNVSMATLSPDGSRVYSKAGKEKLVWSTDNGEVIPHGEWQDVLRQQRHGSWSIIRSGDLILLVDTEFKNIPRERAFREFKAAAKPWWHDEKYSSAVKEEDWYAACFHSAWLLKLSPESTSAYETFHRSHTKLKPAAAKLVPLVVKEALSLPKPMD